MMQTKSDYLPLIRPLVMSALHSPGLLSPNDFKLTRYSLHLQTRNRLLDPDIGALEDYLIDNSNLPGDQSNYALLHAFGDVIDAICHDPDLPLALSYQNVAWLMGWLNLRHPSAYFGEDPDSPLQMLQMAAALGYGEWAATFTQIEAGVDELLALAESPLWRVRDAAALGLQRLLMRSWRSTVRRLRFTLPGVSHLERIAIVNAITAPDLLDQEARVLDAIEIVNGALRELADQAAMHQPQPALEAILPDRIAQVVAAYPAIGFSQLRVWANWSSPAVQAMVRDSLNHLDKWQSETAAIHAILDRDA